MSPKEWKQETDKLMNELKEVDALLEAQTDTEEQMLEYVLNFSELMKSAAALYEQATSQDKRKLAHLVFSERTLFDGTVISYRARPEFAILLDRPIQFGSRGRIRTDDPFVNSELLYR